jgi:hypothetical protein
MYVIQHCLVFHPSDSTVSKDAGIEPNSTVATLGIDSRDALTTFHIRLDLIQD